MRRPSRLGRGIQETSAATRGQYAGIEVGLEDYMPGLFGLGFRAIEAIAVLLACRDLA